MTTSSVLDPETAAQVADSLRELFAERARQPGAISLAQSLAELGWAEVRSADPAAATTLLFVEHGRARAESNALDDVLLAELAAFLPTPAGSRVVLYPDPQYGDAVRDPNNLLHGLIHGSLSGLAEVVLADDGGLRIVPADRLAGAVRAVVGFDPGSTWFRVTADASVLADSPLIPADGAWTRAVSAGRRALAAELIGLCEAASALAVAHTSARVQYGRPIATFQAVRHRLSESHVAIEAARSILAAAWVTSADPDGGAWAATLAKLRAGQAQAEVMRNTVQVSGAMGLSQEGAAHGYVTRAAVLDSLLGSHRLLTEEIGTAILNGAPLVPIAEIWS